MGLRAVGEEHLLQTDRNSVPVVVVAAERRNRVWDQSAEPAEFDRCHQTGRRWVLVVVAEVERMNRGWD
jgi:hypothetical protein